MNKRSMVAAGVVAAGVLAGVFAPVAASADEGVEPAHCENGTVEVVRVSVIREAASERSRPVGVAMRGDRFGCTEVSMGEEDSRHASWVTLTEPGTRVVVGYAPTMTDGRVRVVDVA